MFFIIFGTRGITSTKEQGNFTCPTCGPNSSYSLKSVRRFFTLYFIPLIPLDSLGEYIECSHCQGTFNEEVLSYSPDPQAQAGQVQAMFIVAMKQVLIGMMLSDRVIDPRQVTELQTIFQDVSGAFITEQDLQEEIAIVQRDNTPCLEMMAAIAPSLSDSGKEKVIRAAYRIALADGVFVDAESEFLSDLSAAMDLTQAHLRGIMSDLMK